jgi:hypothetical protein
VRALQRTHYLKQGEDGQGTCNVTCRLRQGTADVTWRTDGCMKCTEGSGRVSSWANLETDRKGYAILPPVGRLFAKEMLRAQTGHHRTHATTR